MDHDPAAQRCRKKPFDQPPEVHDKTKKTPTKKKTVKKQSQQQPRPENEASSDEGSEQSSPAPASPQAPEPPQAQPLPQAQQYAPQQSPAPAQLPGQQQGVTIPPGKTDMVHDVALQPLRDRKHMISETIGNEHMKEIQEKRDKEGDEKQSLKIKISLDLDVEVHLSARVKGDVTIGLL